MDSDLFSKHPEWHAVCFIVETLEKHGHQAVLAGGCVRDALLGRMAQDLDVATNATPDEVEAYFSRVVPVGKSFGVCRVVHEGQTIEVATFRQESDYVDGRRPSKVEYSTLEKDAERRDFTINALYYDIGKNQVIDMVGGKTDLQNKCVKAVGDPLRRMSEDYLRILRGVRFAGHLEFAIEERTLKALMSQAIYLPRISHERIYDELNKMFKSMGRARCVQKLLELDILPVLFPDWDLNEKLKVYDGTISLQQAFARIAEWPVEDSLLGWTIVYHLRSQRLETRALIKEFTGLKVPRASIEACQNIVDAKEFLTRSGDEQLTGFVALASSGFLNLAEAYWDNLRQDKVFSTTSEKFKRMYFKEGQLPPPLVTGHDLIKFGIPQNPEMKTKLQLIYLDQLKHPGQIKEELLQRIVVAGN